MTLLCYGNDPCPICGQKHRLPENSRARFLALRLMAELSTTITAPDTSGAGGDVSEAARESWLRVTGGRSQRFMAGVLVSGHNVLISRSGTRTGSLSGVRTSLGRLGIRNEAGVLTRYTVTVAGHVSPPFQSRGGCPIDLDTLEALRPPGTHPAMGGCAAPHLVLEALAMGLDPSTFALSEVWYHPNTAHRRGVQNYEHGISAYHCESCRLLVPALICPSHQTTSRGLVAQHEARIRGAGATATSNGRITTGVSVSELRKKFGS